MKPEKPESPYDHGNPNPHFKNYLDAEENYSFLRTKCQCRICKERRERESK